MRWSCCLAALCLAALAPALASGRRLSQIQFPPPDALIVPLPTDSLIYPTNLASGVARTAVLTFGRADVFGFSVARRGKEFPDLLLSMEVVSAGAEADIFCRPVAPNATDDREVFISNAVWSSNHTAGTDYVFISRNHTQFNEVVRVQNTDAGITLFSDIICNTWSLSDTEAEVVVELDVVQESRSLVERERDAVEAIFDECCGEFGCPVWRAMGEELFGGEEGAPAPFDLCHVRGSVCDGEGHAVRINMAGWGLECVLPVDEFKKFPALEKLDLSHNALEGKVEDITAGLTSLRNLVEFRAAGNAITGFIDSLSVCRFARRNMTVLNLEANSIDGPLPDCLFSEMTTLKELHLGSNNLSSPIPDVFPENSTIEVLSLQQCGLTGTVPKSVANLTNLRSLELRDNELTGKLNDNLFRSEFLKIVHLQNNGFTGKIPSSIAESPVVRVVQLHNNSFNKFPNQWIDGKEAGLSTNLKTLTLGNNSLKGDFPVVLGRLQDLRALDISNNKLSGPLPAENALFPKTTALQLTNNAFDGPIPDEWGTMGIFVLATEMNPTFLDMRNNSLSGELPDFFLDASNFEDVAVLLGGNNFTCPTASAAEDDDEPLSTAHLSDLDC